MASTIILFAVVGAGAQNLLKGNVLKQNDAKPNTDLVDRYGETANDPAVADALRKAQGNKLSSDEINAKIEADNALQNGVWKPGADPMMALMYGFVPPNMSPEQAAIMAKQLPKMPKMPHPITPEDIARMAGEPEPQMTTVEPESPYIPYPEAFAKARGIPTTRQLQRIPQQTFPGQMAGMPGLPNIPGMPMMGFGSGTCYGLSREEIASQNQKIAEECIRARFGPINVPTLQPGRNWLTEEARKKNEDRHIEESDHQSVVGVCDNLGNEITGIAYDPYGQPTVLHGGTVMPTFMYKGMFWHDRSKNYLAVHRVYNPALGRWLSRDPLGEVAGTNLYAYVDNNPISYSDPSGLFQWYGNWGGPDWTNGSDLWRETRNFPYAEGQMGYGAPIDPRDWCYYYHDVCLHNAASIGDTGGRQQCRGTCDTKLANCLRGVRQKYGGEFGFTQLEEWVFSRQPNRNPDQYIPTSTPYPLPLGSFPIH